MRLLTFMLAALAASAAFGASVETSRYGALTRTNEVVTAVDLSGLARTDELPPAPDYSTNNTELVGTIEAAAPVPGNYAAVSNAAMSALQSHQPIDHKQDKLPYPTNAIPYAAIAGKPAAPDYTTSNDVLVATIEATAPAPGDYANVSNKAMSAAPAVKNDEVWQCWDGTELHLVDKSFGDDVYPPPYTNVEYWAGTNYNNTLLVNNGNVASIIEFRLLIYTGRPTPPHSYVELWVKVLPEHEYAQYPVVIDGTPDAVIPEILSYSSDENPTNIVFGLVDPEIDVDFKLPIVKVRKSYPVVYADDLEPYCTIKAARQMTNDVLVAASAGLAALVEGLQVTGEIHPLYSQSASSAVNADYAMRLGSDGSFRWHWDVFQQIDAATETNAAQTAAIASAASTNFVMTALEPYCTIAAAEAMTNAVMDEVRGGFLPATLSQYDTGRVVQDRVTFLGQVSLEGSVSMGFNTVYVDTSGHLDVMGWSYIRSMEDYSSPQTLPEYLATREATLTNGLATAADVTSATNDLAQANAALSESAMKFAAWVMQFKWDAQEEICYRSKIENGHAFFYAVTNIDLTAVENWEALKAYMEAQQ